MTNFIFKSQGTFKKISNQLDIILAELRHSRSDNVLILSLLHKILINKHLQTQVDDYLDRDDQMTSPQTDTEESVTD